MVGVQKLEQAAAVIEDRQQHLPLHQPAFQVQAGRPLRGAHIAVAVAVGPVEQVAQRGERRAPRFGAIQPTVAVSVRLGEAPLRQFRGGGKVRCQPAVTRPNVAA